MSVTDAADHYGGPNSCRLAKFWTTTGLINLAERLATHADAGAADILREVTAVRDKISKAPVCNAKMISEKELDAARSRST